MGFHTENRILSWKLPPSAKMVLYLLAHHQDDRSGRCDPSIARLVAESGLAIRTVYYALKQLVACRAITVQARPHRRSAYHIAETAPDEIAAIGGDDLDHDQDDDLPAGRCAAPDARSAAPDARSAAKDAQITATDAQITGRITASGAQMPATGAQMPATGAQITASAAPYQKDQKNQKRIRAARRPAAASSIPIEHHPGRDQHEPGTTDRRPGRAHAPVMPANGTDCESAAARPSGQDPEFLDDRARPWHLSRGHRAGLERDYPDVDVAATLENCARWCARHPEWRRPPGGMYRAIQTWFSRERAGGARTVRPAQAAAEAIPDLVIPTVDEAMAVLFPDVDVDAEYARWLGDHAAPGARADAADADPARMPARAGIGATHV
jgi:hypothetical protein